MLRYGELWHTTNEEEKKNKNIFFYVQLEEMCHPIKKVTCILAQVIQAYNPIMKFKVSTNHVYVHVWEYPQQEWFPCEYKLDQHTVDDIVNDQPLEWKILANEEEIDKETIEKDIEMQFEERTESHKRTKYEGQQENEKDTQDISSEDRSEERFPNPLKRKKMTPSLHMHKKSKAIRPKET